MPIKSSLLTKRFIENLKNDKFVICHFQDFDHPTGIPFHYRIFIPITDESYVLLGLITSKVQQREKFYQNNQTLLRGLIKINQKELKFLKKESVIDCNKVELASKAKLIERISLDDFKIICCGDEIPIYLQKQIIQAIQNSPMVKPNIK